MSDSSSKPRDKGQDAPASATSNFTAFTLKADRSLRKIKLDVGITPVTPGDKGIPRNQISQYSAIVDTAAERTRVSRNVIETVGLELGGNGTALHYRADIYMPNMIRFTEVPVTEISGELGIEVDCLIGMDILSCADCCLSHKGGKMMFSFRVPPLGAIDFVEEHRRLHKGARRMVTTSATRNQLCPCGSGKRFKNCCGKIY